MTTHLVTYQVDDSTTVRFEVDPVDGFRPANADQVLGRVRDAVTPAVEAAKAVLDKVKEVTFEVKVRGGADWIVAKSAGEASFKVTPTWARGQAETDAKDAKSGEGATKI